MKQKWALSCVWWLIPGNPASGAEVGVSLPALGEAGLSSQL